MPKTLVLDPDYPPHTNTIPLDRAVFWNTNERTKGKPTDALAQMLANLLSVLIDGALIGDEDLSRILSMHVIGVETLERQPPFHERDTNPE